MNHLRGKFPRSASRFLLRPFLKQRKLFSSRVSAVLRGQRRRTERAPVDGSCPVLKPRDWPGARDEPVDRSCPRAEERRVGKEGETRSCFSLGSNGIKQIVREKSCVWSPIISQYRNSFIISIFFKFVTFQSSSGPPVESCQRKTDCFNKT